MLETINVQMDKQKYWCHTKINTYETKSFPPEVGFHGHELGILLKMKALGKTFLKFP